MTGGSGTLVSGGTKTLTAPPSGTATYTVPASRFFCLTAIPPTNIGSVAVNGIQLQDNSNTSRTFPGGLVFGPGTSIVWTNNSPFASTSISLLGCEFTN